MPPGAVLAGLARTVSVDACAPRSQGYIYERTLCAVRCCRLPLPVGLTLAGAALCRAPIMGGHKLDLHALFTIVLENQV